MWFGSLNSSIRLKKSKDDLQSHCPKKTFLLSWPVIISTRCLTTRNLPWVCHHRITGSLYGTGRTDVNRLLCHRRLGCSLLCKAFSLAGSVTPGKAIAACITTYILYPSRVASYGIILSIRSISFPSARREEDIVKGIAGLLTYVKIVQTFSKNTSYLGIWFDVGKINMSQRNTFNWMACYIFLLDELIDDWLIILKIQKRTGLGYYHFWFSPTS